jgi:3-deoxy-D-manno-octulosonic-acid transferase
MKTRRPRLPSARRISADTGGAVALALYRGLLRLLSPAAPVLLRSRARRGKEDSLRLSERRGIASRARPSGDLIWIHGASVGESLAALPLISELLKQPRRSVLVTTGTVTSAKLMQERLPPPHAFHQYVPIDSPAGVQRFLAHWQPDLALFVESELWPNLLLETRSRGIPLVLVNARLSERSFRGWRYLPGLARHLLSAFDLCLAQDSAIAERLRALGAPCVRIAGSLKADVPPLPFDETALSKFRTAVGTRPLFLAASTHPGEEELVLEASGRVRQSRSDLLTVIVPRHPHRGAEIEVLARARGFSVSRRARGEFPGSGTEIYLADTMGELGLFYRAAPFAFLGGSLVPHGGQNPLEAARLHTAIITGPYTQNFEGAFLMLLEAQGQGRVSSAGELADLALRSIMNPLETARLAALAAAAAKSSSGALAATLEAAENLLAGPRHART